MDKNQIKDIVDESFKEYKTYVNRLNEIFDENKKSLSEKDVDNISSEDLDKHIETSLMRESTKNYIEDFLKKTEVYLYFGEITDLDEEIQSSYRTLQKDKPKQHYALVSGNIKPIDEKYINKIKSYLKDNESIVKEVENMVKKMNNE